MQIQKARHALSTEIDIVKILRKLRYSHEAIESLTDVGKRKELL